MTNTALEVPDVGTEIQTTDLVTYEGMALRPKRELAFQEAQYVLDTLYGTFERSQFYMGDLLNFCKSTMGEAYAQLIDETKYSIKTLQNFMWVASRVVADSRWDTLTFDHHASVARLDPDEQDRWLNMAAEGSWSARRLREELKGPPKEKEPKYRKVKISCPECECHFEIEID